jgi:hypothetical protein
VGAAALAWAAHHRVNCEQMAPGQSTAPCTAGRTQCGELLEQDAPLWDSSNTGAMLTPWLRDIKYKNQAGEGRNPAWRHRQLHAACLCTAAPTPSALFAAHSPPSVHVHTHMLLFVLCSHPPSTQQAPAAALFCTRLCNVAVNKPRREQSTATRHKMERQPLLPRRRWTTRGTIRLAVCR